MVGRTQKTVRKNNRPWGLLEGSLIGRANERARVPKNPEFEKPDLPTYNQPEPATSHHRRWQ